MYVDFISKIPRNIESVWSQCITDKEGEFICLLSQNWSAWYHSLQTAGSTEKLQKLQFCGHPHIMTWPSILCSYMDWVLTAWRSSLSPKLVPKFNSCWMFSLRLEKCAKGLLRSVPTPAILWLCDFLRLRSNESIRRTLFKVCMYPTCFWVLNRGEYQLCCWNHYEVENVLLHLGPFQGIFVN